MATKKWFVRIGDEEMGPLGPRGMRKLVHEGRIAAGTLVRREDHAEPTAAEHVRGLLPAPPASAPHGAGYRETGGVPAGPEPAAHRVHHPPQPKIHGPYTSLRGLGGATAAALALFALLGALGVRAGMGQLQLAAIVAGGAEPDAAAAVVPLLGLGVWAVLALVAVGGLFVWWLWTARVNLPHLILAHPHYAPSIAIAAWFLPFVNLVQPFAVVREVDRLSAEADADGDARVTDNIGLLLPWWVSAVVGTVLALTYTLVGKGTQAELMVAGWIHVAAGAATVLAGVLAAAIVLRITRNQERAHERHPDPVALHREYRRHTRAVADAAS